MRHAARSCPGAGQAGGQARTARAAVAARSAAADRTGLGDRSAAGTDGSGSLVVALDLRSHEAVAEHSGGPTHRVPLTPDRPVADVTREVLAAVARLAGDVEIDPAPQEVWWSVP